MAFRGGGRGRGRGGFGGFAGRHAKPLPFELFPEIPALGKASDVNQNKSMAVWYSKFEIFCKSSAYYIEDANERVKKNLKTEIERFSNRDSGKIRSKAPLSDFIKIVPGYVPAELVKGNKMEKRGIKRVRWNAGSDMQLDDLFSKRLQEHQSEKANEKKEEQEEDDDVRGEEDEEEYSDDGDYNTNVDFDDDEDDFNMPDDNDDEPIF